MHRLAILACEVFESELAHLINNSGITRIFMERTIENNKFAPLLESASVRFFNDIAFMPRVTKDVSLIVNILPIGLHVDIDDLNYGVNTAIDKYKNVADAFLLMYGSCGNALNAIIAREDVELYYPNCGGTIVDDCVCSLLGPEAYLKELARGGSFFVIPGFAYYRDKMVERISEHSSKEYDDSMTRMMLEVNNYQRALFIEEGIESSDIIAAEHLLAERFDLPIDYTCGNLDIIRTAFDEAVDAVR